MQWISQKFMCIGYDATVSKTRIVFRYNINFCNSVMQPFDKFSFSPWAPNYLVLWAQGSYPGWLKANFNTKFLAAACPYAKFFWKSHSPALWSAHAISGGQLRWVPGWYPYVTYKTQIHLHCPNTALWPAFVFLHAVWEVFPASLDNLPLTQIISRSSSSVAGCSHADNAGCWKACTTTLLLLWPHTGWRVLEVLFLMRSSQPRLPRISCLLNREWKF